MARSERVEDLVRQVAARHPDRPALVGPDGTVGFAELECRAAEVAGRLRVAGACAGTPVAVWLPRSVEHVVAILACWHAGAVCVPVDPALPRSRVETMLRVAGCRLVVHARHQIEVVDGVDGNPSTTSPALAYVFFTSGSSAEPKAVGVPHVGVVNEARWTAEAFGLSEKDSGSWLSSPGFAISRWELWSALAAGACVRIAGEGVEWSGPSTRDWLVCERVTWSVVVTSLGEQLFDLPWPPDGALRLLVTGGEQLRKWPDGLPFIVVNSYGVTETSGVRSVAWLPPQPPARGLPSIGKPVADTWLHVLDDEFTPVPSGTTGELYVGGFGLAHGYLGQQGTTAERFLPDPFAADGSRMYRTGDLVLVNADGDVEFLGRRSDDVKIDGVRVDVAEVESVLLAHPGVVATAVAVARFEGRLRLVAHVVPRPGPAPAAHELRAFLAQRLPRAMVPTTFAAVTALPLLPSGKIDRARLPEPVTPLDDFTECADDTEREVVEAFHTVLGLDRPIGAHDDFLGLGGDSLGLAKVRAVLGGTLPMEVLFESRTPRRIAAALRAPGEPAAPTASGNATVVLARDAQVLPLSPAQERLWFLDELDPGSTRYLEVVTVRMTGELDEHRLRRALDTLMRRQPALRTAIAVTDSGPVQVVRADVPWRLTTSDAVITSDEDLLVDLDAHGLLKPVDLEHAPLARFRLCRAEEGWVLAIAVHHVVWDGRSAEVLVTELAASYDAERPESSPTGSAPELQAEPESSPRHWVDALAGAPRDVWPDPLPPLRALGVVEHEIADEDVTALRALAATLGATPFVLGLACFSLALRRWHSNEEVVVCTPVSVRPAAAEHLIGLHVNILPLRLVTPPQLTGRKFIDAVRRTGVEAWHHRDVAFQRIIEAAAHGRRRSAGPPYSQVMFLHNRFPDPVATVDGVRWSVVHLPSREPKCDLLVAWNETAEGWAVRVEHALARLDTTVAEQLVGDMLAVLKALADDPDTELGALPGRAVRPALDDRIAGMWCAILAVDTVERDANFFELGGNSMAAMRLVTALRATFGVRVPVRLVFDTDTFADFVQRLRRDYLGATTEG